MRLLRATGLLFLLCALRWSHGAKKEKAERIKGGVQTPENATASAESAVQTLDIEHAFGFDDQFTLRGVATFRSLKGTTAASLLQNPLNSAQVASMQSLALNGGIYLIRVKTKMSDEQEQNYVSTFISACAMVGAQLSDVITVATNGQGNVIGLLLVTHPLMPHVLNCKGLEVTVPHKFNTTLLINSGAPGPVPDVQNYLQKLEKEEKERQDMGGDNRTFLQKYWMYIIVGFFVYVMLQTFGGGAGGGVVCSLQS
ncbi:hypothetical protein EMCRGX_G009266 [Ephydatia muelleri]